MKSRKRPSKANQPFLPPFSRPEKLIKLTAAAENTVAAVPEPKTTPLPLTDSPAEKFAAILADAGCTLVNPAGPPYFPSDSYNFRRKLDRTFSQDSSLRTEFLQGLAHYISSPACLRRVLQPCYRDGLSAVRNDSLIRLLLLVKSIQQDIQEMLLEKLPEYFDMDTSGSRLQSSSSLDEDVARLIINQFRWLDFVVDPNSFAEKLLQILTICPHQLKTEIIGSLPEIVGDQNNSTVIRTLQQMLQEDSSIIIPVLDSFSNLSLDDLLHDEVIMIALSCIRTVDVHRMPYLLKFLLLSAKASNARRIISQIREQLNIFGRLQARSSQHSKLKGKIPVNNAEASILDAFRSSLRFKNMLCEEILKELKCIDEPRDHKVLDIWLLTLVYMNCESSQKSVEKIFKMKIIEACIQEHMFDQCIRGLKEFSKDYLPTFLSLSAYILACKEQRTQEFGIHMYMCLFEEFCDSYSRQEVVGALLTHVGSGIAHEVSAALSAMVNLASENLQDLIPLSSHITGLLDYLEGFSAESLHKVYEVFVRLAVSVHSAAQSYSCSIGNELLMILRKQLNNSDLVYKKMGVIGTLKMVSHLADINNTSLPPLSQRSNYEEAVDLLILCLESCKLLPLPLILFYEELVYVLQSKAFHPTVMQWVGKHAWEFEPIYLADLNSETGDLLPQDSSYGVEGELLMNLDGDISRICLNVLPLVSQSFRSSSPLQVLPTKFILLSVVEKLSTQGSLEELGGLLGCPIYLPSSKLFVEPAWQSLTAKQKHIAIFSLYYAANWMRELLNAFSTQVVDDSNFTSKAIKEEINVKLLKRLRNLLFIECLLDNCLKDHHVLLPELYPYLESLPVNELSCMGNLDKVSQRSRGTESTSQNNKRNKRSSASPSANLTTEENVKQLTLADTWRKAGAITSQEAMNVDSSITSSETKLPESAGNPGKKSSLTHNREICSPQKFLKAQEYKFRPLSIDCLSMVTCLKFSPGSCCADTSAQLPLYLYLLRDLNIKLDSFSPTNKQMSARCSSSPAGLMRMKATEFLKKIGPLFPYIRKHLDHAVLFLKNDDEACEGHWKSESSLAANPEIIETITYASATQRSVSVFKETLGCFGKILNIPDVQKEKDILSNILQAFQPTEVSDSFFQGVHLNSSPGSIGYLYCGAYAFLGDLFDVAISFSFRLASEVLLTLEFMVTSIRMFLNRSPSEARKDTCTGFAKEALPLLTNKLWTYSKKILMNKFDRGDDVDDSSRSKGEIIQRILRIYLENSPSTSDLLNELACSILPQVFTSGISLEDDNQSFPTLCPATMVIWYRVMHEENVTMLNKMVKEVAMLEKSKVGAKGESIERLLSKILQSVNVIVSLTNMCKTNDKVTLRGMAVKYGGKFIDSFLKVFDFLQAQFQTHRELILNLIRELQKATRVIQTLCSEAKGSKQTAITGKIPATKRSMERFLFRVKALLCTAESGCKFWMGNLKHKDLSGNVVSSQAYLDEHNEEGDMNSDLADTIGEDQPMDDAAVADSE